MAKDKIKFALWMHPETRDAVDEYYKTDGCSSRAEYIEKAILFYTAHIAAKEQAKYATDSASSGITEQQVTRAVDSGVAKSFRPFERNVCAMLYHLAVETAVLSKLMATRWSVDEQWLDHLRRISTEYVHSVDGRICFEDAMWYQGEEEYPG